MTGGSGTADEPGQVSEVDSLEAADPDTPIQPDQAVAGYPDSESGSPDEGPAGPNANTNKDTDRQRRDPEDDRDNG